MSDSSDGPYSDFRPQLLVNLTAVWYAGNRNYFCFNMYGQLR